MGKVKPRDKFIIKGELVEVGINQLQYVFQINPLHITDRVFRFMMYCRETERDKSNPENSRAILARTLKKRHKDLWYHYHVANGDYDDVRVIRNTGRDKKTLRAVRA